MSGAVHTFPTTWGATIVEGGARFRLWAPAQRALKLRTPKGDLPMEALPEGWFELVTDAVAPGEGYGFVLDDGFVVPDPAARAQIDDVHGLSRLVDPAAYAWRETDWRGRSWEETVIHELHVGTFSEAGTFAAIAEKLDYLAHLGVTALELMPVAQFGGRRGWGYDGVLFYAPHTAYGRPEDLKALVDAAHGRGLMVFLDVVYNHFGPDGNYIARYAPAFFHEERHTPWGAAIAYDEAAVRTFFVENPLYWLEEYRLDGLRFDAIDNILDDTNPPIIEEIARAIRARITDRPVHLHTEDERNIVHLHPRDAEGRPVLFTAEWNDDYHNVVHAIATGESEGYYVDHVENRWLKLARALTEGFVFQGEPSRHHGGEPRGEPSTGLPLTAFVAFDQNHDQVGNRAFGERLIDLAEHDVVAVLTAMLLLSPQIPLLFMGEEWGETRPFCFFTDFHGELAEAVRKGRRNEFRKFAAFADPATLTEIPDPNDPGTFESSRIDWAKREDEDPRWWLDLYRRLLALRAREIVPRLAGLAAGSGRTDHVGEGALAVSWRLGDGSRLAMRVTLVAEERTLPVPAEGRLLFRLAPGEFADPAGTTMPGHSIAVFLAGPEAGA